MSVLAEVRRRGQQLAPEQLRSVIGEYRWAALWFGVILRGLLDRRAASFVIRTALLEREFPHAVDSALA